jgi:hypothetical protein
VWVRCIFIQTVLRHLSQIRYVCAFLQLQDPFSEEMIYEILCGVFLCVETCIGQLPGGGGEYIKI